MKGASSYRLYFFLLLAVTLAAAIFDFPGVYNQLADQVKNNLKLGLPKVTEKPFSLGLDLQGGTHLVYSADVSKIAAGDRGSAIEGVRDVLERRVNAFGVSEPNVQTSRSGEEWNVIVELAGVKDVNQAITMIGETPALDFRIQGTTTAPVLTPDEQKQLDDFNADAKKRAEEALQKALVSGADFSALAVELSEEPNIGQTQGMLGFLKRGSLVPEFEKTCFDDLQNGQVSPNLTQSMFGYHVIKKIDSRGSAETLEVSCQHIVILTQTPNDIHPVDPWIQTELSGEYLRRAQVIFDPNTGQPQVMLDFDEKGKELFTQLTTDHTGNFIGIFLDNEPISVPRVNEPITTGNAVITGNFQLTEAKLLAQRLNAGALRVPIKLIAQATVGPTLGQISIEQSLKAGLIGLVLVIIFMFLIYRLPGLVADISLIIYGIILLAVFKLIPVTLTLAGLFGFILSIGMAVDANILIFERMKEELRKGKTLRASIDEAFKRAWPSIRDGNYSTLITSAILVWFSTSVVKGFAITLIIGIVISIFNAMVITRLLLNLVSNRLTEKHLWLFGVRRKKV